MKIYHAVLFWGIFFLAFSTCPSMANANDSLRIAKLEEELSKLKESSGGTNWNDLIGNSVIALVGIGIIGGLFRYFAIETKKRLIENFEERVIQVINKKKELVDLMINRVDTDQRLLKTKRIFLKGEENNELIKKVLKNVGFNFQNLITTVDDTKQEYDLILINNEHGTLENLSEIAEQVNRLPDKVLVFYFNTTNRRFPSESLSAEKADKVNFATNAAQLYGNLLNTLRYQDHIKKASIRKNY